MKKEKSPARYRLFLLFWILVAVFYSYLATDYIRTVMRDDEFGEYVEFAVDLVGRQGRSAAELRQLVDAKARELSLPLDEMNIEITDDEHVIGVTLDYKVGIDVPVIPRIRYEREFRHAARFNNR